MRSGPDIEEMGDILNIAILLAGGSGVRVGSKLPKQFIEVAGKPIIAYTLQTLQADPMIDEIVLVCIAEYIDRAMEICDHYAITKVKGIHPGGYDFEHSCLNGMNALRGKCTERDVVVIVSADRPFVSTEEIHDAIATCERHGSGVAARKCSLCMFMVKEDRTHSRDYQREALVQTATPWAFRFDPLMEAMDLFESGHFPDCEAYPLAIYAAAGHEIYFSKASPNNFKITEFSDILLMEKIIETRGEDLP